MQKNTQLNFIHIQQQSPNKNTSIYSFVKCSLGSYSVAGTLHLPIGFIEHKLKFQRQREGLEKSKNLFQNVMIIIYHIPGSTKFLGLLRGKQ